MIWLVYLLFLLPLVPFAVLLVLSCFGFGVGLDWLAERLSGKPSPDDDAPALDLEIRQLAERIQEQERAAGSGTWLSRAVLWRNRKRLIELGQRKLTLIAAQKRREAREKGVRLPGNLPARPLAVQVPVIGPEAVKR